MLVGEFQKAIFKHFEHSSRKFLSGFVKEGKIKIKVRSKALE
jgi:hypothetical protein